MGEVDLGINGGNHDGVVTVHQGVGFAQALFIAFDSAEYWWARVVVQARLAGFVPEEERREQERTLGVTRSILGLIF